MSSAFDPYYEWLGIAPKDQPPHHYRLLGVELFEQDPHLIEMAVEQRTLLVRSRQIGKHSDVSQKLLSELAVARRTLLDAATRGRYDEELRAKLAAKAAPEKPVAEAAVPEKAAVTKAVSEAPVARPVPRPQPKPMAKPVPVPVPVGAVPVGEARPVPVAAAVAVTEAMPGVSIAARPSVPRGGQSPWQNPVVLAIGGLAGVALVGLAVWATSRTAFGPVVQAPAPSPAVRPATTPLPVSPPSPPRETKPVTPASTSTNPLPEPSAGPERDPALDPSSPPEGSRPGGPRPSREIRGGPRGPRGSDGPPRGPRPSDPGREGPDAPPPMESPPSDPPGTPAPPEPELAPTSARRAVPTEADLTAQKKAVRELLQAEFIAAKSADQKRELAHRLTKIARDEAAGSARQYAALDLARELAAGALDASGVAAAAKAIAEQFDVAERKLQQESLLAGLTGGGSAAAKKPLAEALLSLIDEELAADEFPQADEALKLLAESARELHDKDLIQASAERRKTITQLAAKYETAKPAFETLKSMPGDGPANLAAGRYLAFVKGDFVRGLPLLKKGSDAELAKLAELELAAAADPKQQLALADGWHAVAAQEGEPEKALLGERAALWYGQMIDQANGLDKSHAQKRLAELPTPKPRPNCSASPGIHLDDLPELVVQAVEGTVATHGASGIAKGPIEWEEGPVRHSIFQHPPARRTSTIQYSLTGDFQRFTAEAVMLPDGTSRTSGKGGVFFRVMGDNRVLWQSRVLMSPGERQACDIDLAKVSVLRLETISTGESPPGHACWLDPRLLDRPLPLPALPPPTESPVVHLDDLREAATKDLASALGRHGEIDSRLRADGNRITWHDERIDHALFAQPEPKSTGEVEYQLDGKFTRFAVTAALLVPTERRDFLGNNPFGGGNPFRNPFGRPGRNPEPREPDHREGSPAESPLVFRVVGDGKILWTSKELGVYGAREICSVSVRGVDKLRLEVQCPGENRFAWAAWLDPKLLGGTPATAEQLTPRPDPRRPDRRRFPGL